MADQELLEELSQRQYMADISMAAEDDCNKFRDALVEFEPRLRAAYERVKQVRTAGGWPVPPYEEIAP